MPLYVKIKCIKSDYKKPTQYRNIAWAFLLFEAYLVNLLLHPSYHPTKIVDNNT